MKKIRKTLENWATAVAFAEQGQSNEALGLIHALAPIRESSHDKVILASTDTSFSEPVMGYMRGLLERMPCDVLALTHQARPGPSRKQRRHEREETTKTLERLSGLRGTICLHQTFTGEMCNAIGKYCGLVRDVKFAVVQGGKTGMSECELPIPVFMVNP